MAEQPLVIVTGAGAGIGKAITQVLCGEGYRVAAVEIDAERLEGLVSEVEGVVGYQADVGNAGAVETVLGQIEAECRLATALVNNAGVIGRTSILETSPEDFWRVMETNLGGVYHFLHFMAKAWVAAGAGGHVVNLSSGHAVIGGYNRAAYAASKAGIEALTRNAAVELGQFGILVNAVAPGFTFTEMSRQSLVGERLAMVNRRLPIRRVAEAEEVAAAVLALISGRVPYMTGQTLRIDGGWSNSDVDYARLQPEG